MKVLQTLVVDKVVAAAEIAAVAVAGTEVAGAVAWVDPLVMEKVEDDSWGKVVEGVPLEKELVVADSQH